MSLLEPGDLVVAILDLQVELFFGRLFDRVGFVDDFRSRRFRDRKDLVGVKFRKGVLFRVDPGLEVWVVFRLPRLVVLAGLVELRHHLPKSKESRRQKEKLRRLQTRQKSN